MTTKLRAVAPDEAPPEKPERPKSVAQAAEGDDRLELLIAMKRRIAQTVSNPDCPPRDLASLTRRLSEMSREIEQIRAAQRQEEKENGGLPDDEEWDAEAL